MTLRLDRLNSRSPIVDAQGRPSADFHRLIQKAWEALEAQEAAQDATINRLRRIGSHTEPTTILQAVDNGANCTITVLDHTRVYADGTTVAITGTSRPALSSNAWYAVFYDDETLEDTTPTFVFTTTLELAQAAKAEGRHYCGQIKTPAAASGDTILSGGAYPAGGNSVGGELA